ncbi:MAG: TonB-dependent receptor [Pseudomonadota bacterium]
MRTAFLTSASMAALAAFASTNAMAQTAISEEDEQPNIIVTGQKTDQDIQEVTASVSVTTAEQIEREPITDLFDIVERIPNVTASFGEQGFAIRGVDQRGVGGNGATLIVFVDDSPLSNQTTFFGPTDSWDLGQVEVFRGPQSTNFGRNALAGAIYLRTRDPSYDWDLRMRGEIGDNGQRQIAIAGGGPIIDDVLAFRVAGNYRESDGFIFNTFLEEEYDSTELKTGRFKLLFEPAPNFSVISTSSYTENFAGEDGLDPTNGTGITVDAEDVVREVFLDAPGLEGTDTFIQSVNATWDVSDRVQIQSITTYQDTDYVRQEDFDGTPAPVAALDRTGVDEAFSQELRVKYFGDRLTLAGGAYYFDNEDGFADSFIVPASIVNSAIPPSILLSRVSQTTNKTTNFAFFADGEFALSDSFDLLFGFRYDNEEIENSSVADNQSVEPLPPGFEFLEAFLGRTETIVEASYEAFLPKAGLRWTINPDANISFVTQRAYRAGGAAISLIPGRDVNEFDPEYLWNFELSARTTWLDGRLRWNANIYYSDWTDQQVLEPIEGFPDFSETVNGGASTLFGFETDISFDVSDTVEIYGGIGYAFTEFDDFPNGNFDEDGIDDDSGAVIPPEFNQENFAGNRFPFAPRWSANFGIAYDEGQGLFGGVDANYQSSVFNSADNFSINECCDRFLVNARIGYTWENFSLSAYVRNAFDTEYFSFLNVAAPGEEFARLGNPRTFAVRLDANF